MNKKGFTLIELLAVIIIIAIIATITTTLIKDSLEESRKNIAKESAYGYKKAVSEYYYHQLMNKNNITLTGTYSIDTNGNLTNLKTTHQIEFDGEKPKSGSLIYIDDELTSGCLVINKYTITFENGEVSNIEKGTCPEQTP